MGNWFSRTKYQCSNSTNEKKTTKAWKKPITTVHIFKKHLNPKKSQQFIEEKQQNHLKIEGNHFLAWI
jgi:hypothetical protein